MVVEYRDGLNALYYAIMGARMVLGVSTFIRFFTTSHKYILESKLEPS